MLNIMLTYTVLILNCPPNSGLEYSLFSERKFERKTNTIRFVKIPYNLNLIRVLSESFQVYHSMLSVMLKFPNILSTVLIQCVQEKISPSKTDCYL